MYFSSRFLGLVCLLMLAVAWLAPHHATAQVQKYGIAIVDSVYTDPEWGSGVLLELDLTPVAHLQGPISFKVWTEEVYQPSKPEVPKSSGKANIFVAFARIMSAPAVILGSVAGAYKARVIEHAQEAYAVTTGAHNTSLGHIVLDSVPKNNRLQVLIPRTEPSADLQILFGIEGATYNWAQYQWQAPYLYSVWRLPAYQRPLVSHDMKLSAIQQSQTRMQGVGGIAVTFHYEVPPYTVKRQSLVATAVMNDKVPLNFMPAKLANACLVSASKGELTVFIPNAWTGTEGQVRIQVDMKLNSGLRLTTDPIYVMLPAANIHQTDFMIKNLNIVWNKPSPTSVSSLQAYLAGSRLEDAEYLPSNGSTEYISKFRCFIPYHLKMASNDTLLFAINSGFGENEHHIYYFTFVPTDLAQQRVERTIPFPSSHSDQIDYIDFQIQSTSSDGKLRYTYMKVYTRKENMN